MDRYSEVLLFCFVLFYSGGYLLMIPAFYDL
jgi:hypothetical protein